MIFFSRWLQAPLYLGLIVAQALYVFQFFHELVALVQKMFFPAIDPSTQVAQAITEQQIMVMVLGMIDVVMIANLLVMVIVGGYETFVSRLHLRGHPDEPEWLSHVNAGALKVKLATALIGISSIHLLRSFIELGSPEAAVKASKAIASSAKAANVSVEQMSALIMAPGNAMFWQVIVHLTFVVSAILLAMTDRITTRSAIEAKSGH
jgi:uncharacterized protein (TIGR00645 family)